jgi:kumamolisin
MDGYHQTDIAVTFGGNSPSVTDVPVDANNSGKADGETTQDICIAGLAAAGASIAVYFQTGTQQSWVEMLGKVANPEGSDPDCSVISLSFYISNGDDNATLANEGITTALLDAVSAAFQDAAVQGVTVCIACGDTGSNSKLNVTERPTCSSRVPAHGSSPSAESRLAM